MLRLAVELGLGVPQLAVEWGLEVLQLAVELGLEVSQLVEELALEESWPCCSPSSFCHADQGLSDSAYPTRSLRNDNKISLVAKGVFSLEKSLESLNSLNSLESLEDGWNLLSFPESGDSGVDKRVVFLKKGGFGGCSPGTKTGTRIRSDDPPERKPERGSPGTKTGTRAHSPKPPFYETALSSPSACCRGAIQEFGGCIRQSGSQRNTL